MNQLNPNTRSLLELAKRADGPSVQTRHRIGRKLARTLSAGAVTLGATAAEAALSANVPVKLLTLFTSGKLGGLVAISIGFGIGGLFIAIASPPRQMEALPPQQKVAGGMTSESRTARSNVAKVAPESAPAASVAPQVIPSATSYPTASSLTPKSQVGEETNFDWRLSPVLHCFAAIPSLAAPPCIQSCT